MKIITLLAVLAILLQDMFGTRSSVGGPMAMLLIVFVTMLAVGIHEARVKRRGVFGWIVSIIAALIGGALGVSAGSMALEMIRPLLHVEGALVSSQHPFLYVASAAMVILTVGGSWMMLQFVDLLIESRRGRATP